MGIIGFIICLAILSLPEFLFFTSDDIVMEEDFYEKEPSNVGAQSNISESLIWESQEFLNQFRSHWCYCIDFESCKKCPFYRTISQEEPACITKCFEELAKKIYNIEP